MRFSAPFLLAALCLAVQGANYTLPNGKVLEEPYIVGQAPDGIEVGYRGGIMFMKFADLPLEIQKEFNYDPAKAAQYEAQQKAAREKRKAAEKAKQTAAMEQYQKNARRMDRVQAETEVIKAQVLIDFLKTEIQKLEEECGKYLTNATTLAAAPPSAPKQRYGYAWCGGFISTGDMSGIRAENTKRQVIDKLGKEYAANKKKIVTFKKELQARELVLVSLKQRLDQLNTQKK